MESFNIQVAKEFFAMAIWDASVTQLQEKLFLLHC